MHVLVLTSLYPPHAVGGYELVCKDVVDRWRTAGHQVTVVTSTARVPGVDDDTAEVGVARLLTLFAGGPPGADHPNGVLAREFSLIRDQRVLRKALRAASPDVVSAWHLGGLSLSLLRSVVRSGVPVVSVACDPWPLYWAAGGDPSRTGVSGRLRTPSDPGTGVTWVACSEALAAQLASSPWSIRTDAVVGLGVDREHFPQVFTPSPSWRWRLLFVGRITAEKGVDTAVRALALLPPEATLTILGHGDPGNVDDLVRLARRLGVADRVTVTSAPRRALRQHYLDADVVVFPSQWDEPFGIVPLEAMACARPVVATGLGGSGEFLDDGTNCLLVTPGDPAAIAARVVELGASPQLRQHLAEGGAKTADAFTTDRLAVRLEHVHAAAASGTRPQPVPGASSSSGAV